MLWNYLKGLDVCLYDDIGICLWLHERTHCRLSLGMWIWAMGVQMLAEAEGWL